MEFYTGIEYGESALPVNIFKKRGLKDQRTKKRTYVARL
jgi:hypothetical protein